LSSPKSLKIKEISEIQSPHTPPNGQTPAGATNITNKMKSRTGFSCRPALDEVVVWWD
jgi:hypothetical protein